MEYSSNDFSYSPSTKTFSAEASDLNWPAGLSRQWFDVRSHRTGRTVRFTFSTTHRDRDFDVTHWTYVGETITGIKVHAVVFND